MGSPAFKAGDTGDPRMAGSIPVHLRQIVVAVPVFVTATVMLTSVANGSARLLSSTPSDGARLEALELIEFEFDSLLIDRGAQITVTRLDGTPFEVTETTVDGARLRAVGPGSLPSGNYWVEYEVQSADGAINEGAVRVSIEAPGDTFNGGLVAVIALGAAMCGFAGLVFRADKRRRPRHR